MGGWRRVWVAAAAAGVSLGLFGAAGAISSMSPTAAISAQGAGDAGTVAGAGTAAGSGAGTSVATAAAAGRAAQTQAVAAGNTGSVTLNELLPGLASAQALGAAPSTDVLTVGVALAHPDASGEQALYNDIYTPGNAEYHQFLTPAEYDSAFGVAPAAVQATDSWLASGGLSIQTASGAGDYITAQGTVAQLGALLGTTFGNYQVGPFGFVANQSNVTVPANLPITEILGLNTLQQVWTEQQVDYYNHFTPAQPAAPAQPPAPAAGSTSYSGELVPQDLWGVYDAPSSDQGQGETSGIFGYGYFNGVIANLRVWEQRLALPQVPVKTVCAESFNPTNCTDANGDNQFTNYKDNTGAVEWELDSQAITGMAPDLSQLDLYFASGPLDPDIAAAFATWANDPNGPDQMNASFGECEEDPTSPLVSGTPVTSLIYGPAVGEQFQLLSDNFLRQATMEGRTLITAAGDTAGSCPAVILPIIGGGNGVTPQPAPYDQGFPCVSAYALCVGGSVVTTDGTNGTGDGEHVQSPPYKTISRVNEQGWSFSGGGPAANVPEPAFQDDVAAVDRPCIWNTDGLSTTPNTSLTTCRGVPDVAAMSGTGLEESQLFGVENGAPSGNVDEIIDGDGNSYEMNADMMPLPEGGTSLSSPLTVGMWSRIQAAAPASKNKAGKTVYDLGFADPTIYAAGTGPNYSRDFYDITSDDLPVGNFYNEPGQGWDYASGFGALDVLHLIQDVDLTGANKDSVTSPAPTHPGGQPGGSPPELASPPIHLIPAVTCNAVFSSPPNNAYDTTLTVVYPWTNQPALDIQSASLTTSSDGTSLIATISGPGLTSTPGAVLDGYDGWNYYLFWTYDAPGKPTTTYFAEATVSTTGSVSYGDGVASSPDLTAANTDSGTFSNGTITITVPLANVGSPGKGAKLLYPYAISTLPDGLLVPLGLDVGTADEPGQSMEVGPC